MHSMDRKQFAKTIKHIMVLKYNDKKKFSELTSFPAFVGVFCNGKCAFHTAECVELETILNCYETFLQQSGKELTQKHKEHLYKLYSGINPKDLGTKYKVPKKPLKGVKKKSKKRINRKVDRAIASVKTIDEEITGKKQEKKKKGKPITTEFFCSEDKEWQEKIDSILGANAANN
jgi:hypothetical protein